jgi:hypothetical protein
MTAAEKVLDESLVKIPTAVIFFPWCAWVGGEGCWGIGLGGLNSEQRGAIMNYLG